MEVVCHNGQAKQIFLEEEAEAKLLSVGEVILFEA